MAWEMEEVGQECLQALTHASVLHYAEHFPGDRIEVQATARESADVARRYIVTDVNTFTKSKSTYYEVWQVTKSGQLYERGGQTMICPSERIVIRGGDWPLSTDAQRVADHYRDRGRQLMEGSRDRGEIEDIIAKVRERRARHLF